MSRTKASRNGKSAGGRRRAKASAGKRVAGRRFPVVGVGASAGGLQAFTDFLRHLPGKTGMAFILVQHLDPAQRSLLPELLSRVTAPLRVTEATDGMVVMPDCVYVTPAGADVTIAKGVLRLTLRGKSPARLHLPVDALFLSLARDLGTRAVGVVLSGGGADGSLGVRAIRRAGGTTFAQDEHSSHFPDMPRSAINTGCVDRVLSPGAIARALAGLGSPGKRRRAGASCPITVQHAAGSEGEYQKIIAGLREFSRVDFGAYRQSTVQRRIARRMALQKQKTMADYLGLLETDPRELEVLYREMLINVTSFFREADMFQALKTAVFPQIIASKAAGSPIRIWVPGCATGQEAYSLAMTLLEVMDGRAERPAIQIFGTDINDPTAIKIARAGLYPSKIEAEVSPQRLARFFTREEGGYRISKQIREMCVFARQDVVADPPFSRLDLISCRNLLIYLSPALQKRVFPTFHYALNPGGILVLGASETVGRFDELFELLHAKHAIYRRR